MYTLDVVGDRLLCLVSWNESYVISFSSSIEEIPIVPQHVQLIDGYSIFWFSLDEILAS